MYVCIYLYIYTFSEIVYGVYSAIPYSEPESKDAQRFRVFGLGFRGLRRHLGGFAFWNPEVIGAFITECELQRVLATQTLHLPFTYNQYPPLGAMYPYLRVEQ